MSITPSSQLRLFGLDLSTLWRDSSRLWQVIDRSPLLGWLEPRQTVAVYRPDGAWALGMPRRAGDLCLVDAAPRTTVPETAFVAVELPEDVFLTRQMTVPSLSDEQLYRAAELEAQASSPFAMDDLVWGCCILPAAGEGRGQRRVEIALASRKQVQAHLRSSVPAGDQQLPEVWAAATQPGYALVIQGFGETRRLLQRKRWRKTGYALLGVIALLLLCIAVTPTLQLRARALDAQEAYTALARDAAPVLAKREALTRSAEQVNELTALISGRVEPLEIMGLLTTLLEDDVVLQRLQIEGRKVLLAGQANNAAALMQTLGAQPRFKDVRAPTAATRPLGATKESFQIELTLADMVTDAGANGTAASSDAASTSPLDVSAVAPVAAKSAQAASTPGASSAPVSTNPASGVANVPPVAVPPAVLGSAPASAAQIAPKVTPNTAVGIGGAP